MTALVVGATSTIGRAIALGLAADGYDLVLWGRDGARAAEVEAAGRALGVSARSECFDLTDRAALDAAAARAAEGLRVVVLAAARFEWGPAESADPDVVESVLDTGLVAAARTAHLLLPALLAAPAPASLVLLGSGADHAAFPNNASYVAAKHGLRGLADALRLEVAARGVRVTLVSPGLVAAGNGLLAPGVDPERLLQPDDVAAAVRFAVAFPGPGSVAHLDLEPGATG